MNKTILYRALFSVSLLLTFVAYGQDAVADNMLLYQRGIGGWPKHFNEVKVDYTKAISTEEKKQLLADKSRNDATIDELGRFIAMVEAAESADTVPVDE